MEKQSDNNRHHAGIKGDSFHCNSLTLAKGGALLTCAFKPFKGVPHRNEIAKIVK